MNVIGLLLENLNLLEQAKSRDKIIDYIYNSEKQRRENLLQLFLFRTWTTTHHWCKELRSSLYELPKLKGKHKLKEKQIYEWAWLSWEDEVKDRCHRWIRDICEKENYIHELTFSIDNIYNYLKDYHVWLSYNLSIDADISVSAVENKIKELLNKYPIN